MEIKMKNKKRIRLTAAVFAVFLISALLCGCSGQKYKTEIFSLVESNRETLADYAANATADGTLPDELSALGVQAMGIDGDIVFFEMYYTGLLDGGVEYGFYYTESTSTLIKTVSSNDFMVTEKITDHWYYYEWHNG